MPSTTPKPEQRSIAMARYTAKLLAAIKHAYEETDRPVDLIATDFDVSSRNIQRLVVTERWKSRRVRKHRPRDVPVALELLAQAQALAAESCHSRESGNPVITEAKTEAPGLLGPRRSLSSGRASRGPVGGDDTGEQSETKTLPPPLSPIDRLEALVLREIEAEEQGRNDSRERRIGDGERRARALATLTQTLQTLQRMRDGTASAQETHYDVDMPVDMDAFRLELARRIDAFMQSRSEDGDAVQG
jgi:hypothetical protein